jgi:hypothetical protein
MTVPPVTGLLAGKVVIHLGVENPFGKRLFRSSSNPFGSKDRFPAGASQQFIEHTPVRPYCRHRWSKPSR